MVNKFCHFNKTVLSVYSCIASQCKLACENTLKQWKHALMNN